MEWERRKGESDVAWEAFLLYLKGDRRYGKVAEKLQKSETLIRRWAKQHEWQSRAVAFDNAVLEEYRQEVVKEKTSRIKALREGAIARHAAGQKLIIKAMSKASARTLNEIITAAENRELEIMEKLGVNKEADTRIEIVRADSNE